MYWNHRAALAVAAALLATSACGGSNSVPSATSAGNATSQSVSNPQAQRSQRGVTSEAVDTTSILKRLKKVVVIGSTVDPTNGDMGGRSISEAGTTFGGLKKGQILVCNYADSSGNAGKGTTIDVFNPTANSKPVTYVRDSRIAGCDADALSSGNYLYAGSLTNGDLVAYTNKPKYYRTYGPPIEEPMSNVDAYNPHLYSAEPLYTSDAKTGSIISFSSNSFGNPKPTQVVTGFAVNNGSGWNVLGPSGLQYYGAKKADIVYVVDGVDNTLVAIDNASNLLTKDEIIVLPGGTTFKCKHKSFTCARLIYHGAPLSGPVAMALLPNGNLIIANTVGGNKLVEIASNGQVLDTRAIDKSSIPHIFALHAIGTTDSDTALFLTDTKTNKLYLWKQ